MRERKANPWFVRQSSTSAQPSPPLGEYFFFFKQKTAYEMLPCLEFRRVLFRSRYALLALLCVFAGLAVVDLSSRVRERRWRSLALAAAVVGAGGAVALLPHAPLRAGPAPQARGQLAAALLGSGRGSEALTVVEEALAETPTARLQTLRGDIL